MKATPRALLLALLTLACAGCLRSFKGEDDSDPAIRARVETALRGRKDLDIRYISIDVNSGVVTISGIVPSPDQVHIIDRIVKLTPGVDTLMNNLVVQE